jgi:glycosyltransferase involved in cell wall biosynthesis
MVRIGFVNYELGTGGIETLILEICKRLNREHFEPVVFTLCSGGVLEKEFIQAGVPVYGVEKRSGKDLGLIFRLAGQMRKAGVYVVHTHNAIAWLYGGIAARLAGVPFVHTEHTSPDHRAERWRKIEKWMSHLTAQITTVSGSVAQFMIDQEHISSKKVQVVYNGIESEKN